MIAIIDYDAGNLKSVEKAFGALGQDTVVTSDPKRILSCDAAVLPGVGSFGVAASHIRQRGLDEAIGRFIDTGKSFLGICLGLQLLFEASEESPDGKGLGIFPGRILKIPPGEGLKIPHIGWNSLSISPQSRIFHSIGEQPYVYFVQSYYLQAENPKIVSATTEYGVKIHAAIESDNVCAMQFHPEKSGKVGLAILQNFIHSIA